VHVTQHGGAAGVLLTRPVREAAGVRRACQVPRYRNSQLTQGRVPQDAACQPPLRPPAAQAGDPPPGRRSRRAGPAGHALVDAVVQLLAVRLRPGEHRVAVEVRRLIEIPVVTVKDRGRR
jgi:hypothetical protein